MDNMRYLNSNDHDIQRNHYLSSIKTISPRPEPIEIAQIISIGSTNSGDIFLKTDVYKAEYPCSITGKKELAEASIEIASNFVDILNNFQFYAQNPKELRLYERSLRYSQLKNKYNLTIGNPHIMTLTNIKYFTNAIINTIKSMISILDKIIDSYNEDGLIKKFKSYKAENPNNPDLTFKKFITDYRKMVDDAIDIRKQFSYIMLQIQVAITQKINKVDKINEEETNTNITPFDIKGFMCLQPIIYKKLKNKNTDDATSGGTTQGD